MATTQTLSRSDVYDIYALDKDIRATHGVGILPHCVHRVFEKYAILGPDSINVDFVHEVFSEFTRAHEQVIIPDTKEGSEP